MLKFNAEELEIIKEELLEDKRCFYMALKEDIDDIEESMINMLTTTEYLLANINNLETEVNSLVLFYWLKDFYDTFDDEVHEKFYTKEENEVYQKILNYYKER